MLSAKRRCSCVVAGVLPKSRFSPVSRCAARSDASGIRDCAPPAAQSLGRRSSLVGVGRRAERSRAERRRRYGRTTRGLRQTARRTTIATPARLAPGNRGWNGVAARSSCRALRRPLRSSPDASIGGLIYHRLTVNDPASIGRRPTSHGDERYAMLHVALVAAAIAAATPRSNDDSGAIRQCFATMDGAVYHGDPTDRGAMKAAVLVCGAGLRPARRLRVTARQGPAKLFVIARLLDRAATLSYMGLQDAPAALRATRTCTSASRRACRTRRPTSRRPRWQTSPYRTCSYKPCAKTSRRRHELHARRPSRCGRTRGADALHEPNQTRKNGAANCASTRGASASIATAASGTPSHGLGG